MRHGPPAYCWLDSSSMPAETAFLFSQTCARSIAGVEVGGHSAARAIRGTQEVCMSSIDEQDARQALAIVLRMSRQQWHHEGYQLDLSEYEDAALDALVACLTRYDATRGVAFSVYAGHRMRGAVQRAWHRYRTWHELRGTGRLFHAPPCAEVLRPRVQDFTAQVAMAERLQRLPYEAPRYAAVVLMGGTDHDYAAQAGLTSARWVKARVQRWREESERNLDVT